MVMPYHLHMPSYFLETFTEYPILNNSKESVYTYFVFTGSLLYSRQWIITIDQGEIKSISSKLPKNINKIDIRQP